ncbi:protein SGT1 homolog [Nilaparvata lugens]|uniref:protein SGT1 homolog n=1 Tax=Nilaparvata lugens TaxID=108931 RepID=UPI00193DEDB4|nr:protein SGT1 homolog [Nilaparvata lugens]XP_039292134.1 protein SGT1 homolog [Nilaparvata lugens]XP_039292135.1 protein SGT1 homolog [Nilaparvata lugens]
MAETDAKSVNDAAGAKESGDNSQLAAKVKYDWYQTDTHVVITILAKNVKPENISTQFEENKLDVKAKLPDDSLYNLHLDLSNPIVPPQSNFKVLTSKIEIKLKKLDGIRWLTLQGEPKLTISKGRDWDKVVGEIEDEKAEGDAAVNSLFQKIYSEGSDEVKKAMNKSFLESGGTVLSTNWTEVAKDKVDIKPPDGMEWKTWEN